MHKKRMAINLWVMAAIFAVAFLPGCLNSSREENSQGTLTGTLEVAKASTLVAVCGENRVLIPVDAKGNFVARLSPGVYQLMLQGSDGQLTLIRKAVEIDNNMTVSVVDTDMVPMPQVVSVAVPLIYSTSAVIEWETGIESDGYVEYGVNELYGYASYATTELKKRHRMQLFSLLPATTYHFRVVASRHNLDSTRTWSRDYSFTTEP
ncbi:MAG: fibronectin type III domain-containing protein [Candidatus Riflebacteria bacterium]|jgi:hypothetical protein|nr:fibronectin type III domain-containing protein [Candidatus Riflebacteria bacterium]